VRAALLLVVFLLEGCAMVRTPFPGRGLGERGVTCVATEVHHHELRIYGNGTQVDRPWLDGAVHADPAAARLAESGERLDIAATALQLGSAVPFLASAPATVLTRDNGLHAAGYAAIGVGVVAVVVGAVLGHSAADDNERAIAQINERARITGQCPPPAINRYP
jgi:hypothetical protein